MVIYARFHLMVRCETPYSFFVLCFQDLTQLGNQTTRVRVVWLNASAAATDLRQVTERDLHRASGF